MQGAVIYADAPAIYKCREKLMGNMFEFSILSAEKSFADNCFQLAIAETRRIEKLLSTYDESSQTNCINNFAGISPVSVDQEVFDLITRCIRISQLTQGAFDISYGSIDKRFWNFDTTMKALPDAAAAKKSVGLINYNNIILNATDQTVFLREKGMRIGFGGIGKGYAAEKVRQVLKTRGVKSGIVNAAGDLSVWGSLPDGKPYTVGIADPCNPDVPLLVLDVTEKSVATSGNYEKYVLIDGKKYSHTIDPRTGFPVSGIKSVTIICANAELADALATPVTVMGTAAGLHLINQLPGVECLIIDDNNKVWASENIKLKQK